MLKQVGRAIETDWQIPPWLARTQLVLECLFPLGIMYALMLLVPELGYTILVSPGYALIMVLIADSVLRVDRTATLLTGTVCFLGYIGLVLWVLASDAVTVSNPHPFAMYFNMALMLGLATLAAVSIKRATTERTSLPPIWPMCAR